ncbi:hypothetical protein KBI23_15480 [bacterium]|nr:hypothetical protein [bacterium]MBP9806927.1 hypothetical protein [bacterium]
MAKLSSKQLEEAHESLRDEARQRIADRGVLQFRADPQTILAVLAASDKAKMPVGAMLRQWVQEKVMLEQVTEKAPDLIERVTFLETKVVNLCAQMETNERTMKPKRKV